MVILDRVPPAGAVMIDSLTLQSALRILGEEGAVQAPEESKFRGDKWDYDLNLALRVAIDIECLAQLVHAIVFHGEIEISPGFRNDYFGRMRSGYGSFASSIHREGLNEVVVPLKFPEDLCRQIFLNSTEHAVKISRIPEFRRHLKTLSSEGLEGVVLDISNLYFGTGYSDASVLPSFELAEQNDDGYIYLDIATRRAFELLTRPHRTVRMILPKYAREYMNFAKASVKLVKDMHSIDPDHALIELPNSRSEEVDKRGAAHDLVRNMTAGLYFQGLAQLIDVPYMPHVLRAPLVVFGSDGSADGNLEQSVARHLQALRRSRVEAIAPVTGGLGFDLEVPLVLAKVLQGARGPHEVIPRAMELRNTRSARRLRTWFSYLHAQLRSPDTDMRYVQRELEGFRVLARQWADEQASSNDQSLTIGINLGMVSFSSPLPIKLREARRRRRLQFLYSLARTGDTTPRFGTSLAGALGEPIAEAWQKAQRTIERFARLNDSSIDHKSLLDLR